MADVELLIEVLHRLVDDGNTVILIEHNLDIIAEADYILDIGPEAGDAGGEVVAAGPPEKIARHKEAGPHPIFEKLSRAGRNALGGQFRGWRPHHKPEIRQAYDALSYTHSRFSGRKGRVRICGGALK